MVLEQCNAVLQRATPHLAGFGHNLQASQKPVCGTANEPVFLDFTFWGNVYINRAPFLAPRNGTWRQKQRDVAHNPVRWAPDPASQIGALFT